MAEWWSSGQIRSAAVVAATFAVIVLATLAFRADERAVSAQMALSLADLAVGLAFIAAAMIGTGSVHQRILIGVIGPAWLAGSVCQSAQSLHQGVLALALLAFPTGRISGVCPRLLAVGGVVVAFGIVPQLWVAALFVAVAIVVVTTTRTAESTPAYPVASGVVTAAVLAFSWWAVQHAANTSPLVLYEATMTVVALGFPLATRAVARSHARLADRVIGHTRFSGLAGLEVVLAAVLDDPGLRIELTSTDLDSGAVGSVREQVGSQTRLTVLDDDGRLLAYVVTTSAAVVDGQTADAVVRAARLAVVNRLLLDQQAARLTDVEASRARLVQAADRERERVAVRLGMEAGAALGRAGRALAATPPTTDLDTSALIEFVAAEVKAATREVEYIVTGVPPVPLGAGRIQAAIGSLADRSPVPVIVTIDADSCAENDIETALFYVCSESLANVAKHAAATQVTVDLHRRDGNLSLTVSDDGRGGADLAGAGLQGLTDRLTVVGGRLTVTSLPEAGTTLCATVRVDPHGRIEFEAG